MPSETPTPKYKRRREDEKSAFKRRSKIFHEFTQNDWQSYQSPGKELRGPDDLNDSQTLVCLEILTEWLKSISSRWSLSHRLFESFLGQVFNGWTSKTRPGEVQIIDKWPIGCDLGWSEGLASKRQVVAFRKICRLLH